MADRRMPALFISHGSPLLAIVDSAARRFLQQLGPALPRPTAIVVFSAHHDVAGTEITGAAAPPTIHDFGGFPRELHEMTYPAPGAPALAEDAAALLRAAGIDARVEPRRGLDHGAWIPLRLMFPAADVPVLQVSIDSGREPAQHFALGRALRPLRERDVLLLASGGATHNLRVYMQAGDRDGLNAPEWVEAFNEWVAGAVAGGRYDDLMRYVELAPYARQNHPSPEHFLPIFAALGAAFDDEHGARVHASYDRGLLSLDAYAFGFDAARAAAVAAERSTSAGAVLH